MKKINPELFKRLRQTESHMVLGFLLERPDGFKLGFTSGDSEFTLDGVVYSPNNAFSGMAATSKSNLSVDNSSVLALTSDDITEWDLQSGRWDNTYVRMFWVCPEEPQLGTIPLRGGKLGEVKNREMVFEAELRALMQQLQQPFGEYYTLECSADFGDDRCKISTTADTWKPNERYIAKAGADAGIGSYVKPTVPNGWWYQCVRAQGNQAKVLSLKTKFTAPPAGLDWSNLTSSQQNAMNKGGLAAMGVVIAIFSAIVEGNMSVDSNSPSGMKWIGSTFLTGKSQKEGVTVEGGSGEGGSFYNTVTNSSGVLVNSEAYLTPTKEGKVPLSAPPGVQPLTITNGSSSVTYALGQSGATEPAWPTTNGAEVTDGQLVWRAIRHRSTIGTVSAVMSRVEFIDNTRDEGKDKWTYGKLTWLTGINVGIGVEIRKYSQQDNYGGFILLEKMPGEIKPGDQYEITIGCPKTRTACKGFDNIHNFRGFPDMPTEERALATPNVTSKPGKKKEDSGGS